MMVLQLQQLLPAYFSHNDQQASDLWLKDLQIESGELVEIIAPSGSGKTSLIHFLYGMRKDYIGDVVYDHKKLRHLDHEDVSALRRNKLSVVFQDTRLFPEETIAANLELKRQLSPFHPDTKIPEMVSRLGISEKLNSRAGNCSYGEQQRAAIVRSLLQPFDILLMDEPFSHLDNANAKRAMELILEEVAARKAAIIFADLERTNLYPATRTFHL